MPIFLKNNHIKLSSIIHNYSQYVLNMEIFVLKLYNKNDLQVLMVDLLLGTSSSAILQINGCMKTALQLLILSK